MIERLNFCEKSIDPPQKNDQTPKATIIVVWSFFLAGVVSVGAVFSGIKKKARFVISYVQVVVIDYG